MNSDAIKILQEIPKTEFHLHIEGAIPHEMIKTIGTPADTKKWWSESFKFDNFEHFDRELLEAVMPWFTSPERYAKAASEIFARLSEQNVQYAEVSFASGIVQFMQVPGDEIAEAIAKSAPMGMNVKVFMGIHHDGRPKEMEKVFEDSLSWKYLDGADLHGDERKPVEDWTAQYWKAVRKSGRFTKAHAGELCGPKFIETAIDSLGVRQIEHGVRAAESPELTARLAREGIVLDVCPTSNVKLRVSPSYAGHQLRILRSAGVKCTLNSDDPLIFGSQISDEYENLFSKMGFSLAECLDVAKDGWSAAKIDESVKKSKIKEIEKCMP